MRTGHLVGAFIALVIVGCEDNNPNGSDRASTREGEGIEQYDSVVVAIERSIPRVIEPLQGIRESQQASLAALLILARAAAYAEVYGPGDDGRLMSSLLDQVHASWPALRAVSFSRIACHDEHLAYASAMASCLPPARPRQGSRRAWGAIGIGDPRRLAYARVDVSDLVGPGAVSHLRRRIWNGCSP